METKFLMGAGPDEVLIVDRLLETTVVKVMMDNEIQDQGVQKID